MTRGAEDERASSWAAGQRAAWAWRGVVGFIFVIIIGGLLGYQASEKTRRAGSEVCRADAAGKTEVEVYAQALRCIAGGLEHAPLTTTNRQDVEIAVQLLIEVLKQASQDHQRNADRALEL